ncbi:MAG: hypothetical protein V8S08_09360 [Lachnoclostridium sp.]
MQRRLADHDPAGESIKNGSNTLKYTYDELGNITKIHENGSLKATYTYDGLSRLIREDNKWLNKTICYSYDAGGNITAKKEYTYTTGTLGTARRQFPMDMETASGKTR